MDYRTVTHSDKYGVAIAREMFLEYQREIAVDLCFQGFDEELASMPGKYGPPSGCLLLVFDGDRAIACGALRDLGEGVCEIKRIYVRPEARRRGLARSISERLIDFGREAGYRAVRLDTMRRLTGATELYEQLGFSYIGAYNASPQHDIVYMERSL
jgi:GNAT superfamily N-acetyltransferase